MRRSKKWIAMILAGVMAFGLCGCTGKDPGGDKPWKPAEKTVCLTEGIKTGTSSGRETDEAFRKAYNTFAAGLFREARKTIGAEFISPYSAYAALAMVMNGADGETLSAMQNVFGLPADELNLYLKTLADRYNVDQSVSVANSVWLNGDFTERVREEFLQTVADYYAAEAFAADFYDPRTREDMNHWVEEKTLGRIHNMMEQLDPAMVMVLFNCLTFDGKWADPFEVDNTKEEDFHKDDGTVTRVQMMEGKAENYFETETYVGFSKNYEDKYYFRAYLPKEGMTASKLAETLTAEQLTNPGTYDGKAHIKMPKINFRSEGMDLIPALRELGMGNAFGTADFSKLTKSGELIHISEVMQKTYLEIDEEGTKAAAATEVGMKCYAVAPQPIEHNVFLDQPFVYAIYDSYNDIPLFIGIYE